MSPTIRQQRAALRRQRRRQRQTRQAASRHRHRAASPHLSRRVRSGDIHSLDERQQRIAQAVLNRRHQVQQLQVHAQKTGAAIPPIDPADG